MKCSNVLLAFVCLIPVVLGGCPLAGDLTAILGIQTDQESTTTDTIDPDTKYDIALMSGSATATLVSEGVYDFVLTDVPTYALAFSESPGRDVRYIPLESFGLWEHMFSDGDPNTVLYERTADDQEIVVFQMGQPTYDANAGTLTFRATLLEDSPAPPANMAEIELLIDPTWGQWINIVWNCGATVLSALEAVDTDGSTLANLVGASGRCARAITSADW